MCSRWKEIGRAIARDVEIAGDRGFAELAAGRAPRLRAFSGAAVLLEHLHGRDGSDPERDGIIGELVAAAKINDGPGRLARALLWRAFWPGLTGLLNRTIATSGEDADELAADLAEKFTIVIARCDPNVVTKMAVTVLWNTRRRFWESLKARSQVEAMEVPLNEEAERLLAVPPEADAVDALRDLERQLGTDAAELVLGCMVEGFTTREVAGRCGVSREAIRKRLQRACARLRLGGDRRSRDRSVPDPGGLSPMWGKGMNQQREKTDGRSDDGQGALRISAARGGHAGGRRLFVRGCGTVDGSTATPAGETRMTAGREPGVRLVVVSIEESPGAGRVERLVGYCDVCRRWGEHGSQHICGKNWSEHLLPVLANPPGRVS